MPNLLEIKNLSVGRKEPLFSGFSATVQEGSLIALTGRNGSGKSTFLRTIAGILPPLSGEILYAGKTAKETGKLSYFLAYAATGKVSENYITVDALIRFGRFPYSTRMDAEADETLFNQIIQKTGIESIRHKYLHEISDGEWQKANLARVLVQNTPLILLDEPAAFLDYPSKQELYRNLSSICRQENKTVIVSTHDPGAVEEFGASFWHLNNQHCIISDRAPAW